MQVCYLSRVLAAYIIDTTGNRLPEEVSFLDVDDFWFRRITVCYCGGFPNPPHPAGVLDVSPINIPAIVLFRQYENRRDALLATDTCYETQNHFASRVTPSDPALSRIHVTPGHPIVIPLGLTFHLRPKRQLALPSGTKSLCFSATGPDLSAAVWEGQTFFRS